MEAQTQKIARSNYIYLLDPGHGGIINGCPQTAGKRSPKFDDGYILYEGELNRDITNRVINLGNKNNVTIKTIVSTQMDVPLKDRVSIANNIIYEEENKGKDGRKCIFISIHSNAFGEPDTWTTANGWEIFTADINTPDSEKIALLIYKYAREEFPQRKMRGMKKEAFYVLKNTKMPAVLVENFFMTNKEEAALLRTGSFRSKLANYLYKSIIDMDNNLIIGI